MMNEMMGKMGGEDMGSKKEALKQLIALMQQMMLEGYGDEKMDEMPEGDIESQIDGNPGDEADKKMGPEVGIDAMEEDEEGGEDEEDDYRGQLRDFMKGRKPQEAQASLRVAISKKPMTNKIKKKAKM